MIKFIILGILIIYCSWVIVKKIKDIKKGKYCSCGCSDCPSKNKCHKSTDES